MTRQQVATVDILGVRVDCVDFAQTLAILQAWIEADDAMDSAPLRQICTLNPEFVIHARRDPHFAATLAAADLAVPDGGGLLWAARRQGIHLKERVTGSDGIYRICERAAQQGWRVYFLGAAPGVATEAARRLQQQFPGLTVVGSSSNSPQETDWPAIQRALTEAKPDMLFVAYGHPKQDLWIARHRHELPAKVAMGVGGAFDFVAGVTKRAPRWMQRLGLEWLFRLLIQPWRWRRMLAIPHFMWLVLRST